MEKPLVQNTPSRSMVIWSMTFTSGVSHSAFGNGEGGATEAYLVRLRDCFENAPHKAILFLGCALHSLKEAFGGQRPFYNTLSGEALAVFFTRFTNSNSIFWANEPIFEPVWSFIHNQIPEERMKYLLRRKPKKTSYHGFVKHHTLYYLYLFSLQRRLSFIIRYRRKV